jgi:Domain of unknown function (DUF1905)/Bacteriocin-protection, YdeI or OmpD-Associated
MDMVQFNVTIKKFGQQGEKTGWTYFEIPADIAAQLKPGNKKSFRVKGKLDDHKIAGVAIIPMGGGVFIMPLNGDMRKSIGKKHGAMLKVQLAADERGFVFNKDFMECLADEPAADKFFNSLTGSHQRYFSKWIDSAKTEPTKTKRIAMAVNALAKKWGYPEMIRASSGKL